MSEDIRLRNRSRLYNFAHSLLVAINRARSVGNNVGTFLPYAGAKKLKSVAVDEVPYPGFGRKLTPGVKHQMDGSRVTFWYTAMHKPTQKQIDKAQYATKVLRIPRKRYTGTLIDVFKHGNGSIYILLGGVLERDRENPVNFRMFNIDDGDLFRAYVETVKRKHAPKKRIVRGARARRAQRKLKKKPRVKKFATKRKKK